MAYANNSALDTKKANLEIKADEFISQMNIAIDLATNKSIDTQILSDLKKQFSDELKQASQSSDDEAFKEHYAAMKDTAEQFKEEIKNSLSNYTSDLKELLKSKKNTEKKVEDTAKNIFSTAGTVFRSIKNFLVENLKRIEEEG